MADTNNKSAGVVTKIDPGSDCTLRNSRSIAASLAGSVNSGAGVEIDCAAIEQADITFVQTIVSAQRSCAARDLPFTLIGMSETARSAFRRAGVTPPGASSSELSGN